jgi:hypothetical protein
MVTLLLSGCIWNVDKPNPFEYERWLPPSSSSSVEITMLECGYPDIFGGAKYKFSDENVVYAERCMRRSGYKQKRSYGDYICENKSYVSACKDNYVPRRDIWRRLNSPYCHEFTKSAYCK